MVELSGWELSCVGTVTGGNCPWWEFSWLGIVRVGFVRLGIVHVGIVIVGIVMGGNCR